MYLRPIYGNQTFSSVNYSVRPTWVQQKGEALATISSAIPVPGGLRGRPAVLEVVVVMLHDQRPLRPHLLQSSLLGLGPGVDVTHAWPQCAK
jgi:hypothetical protein